MREYGRQLQAKIPVQEHQASCLYRADYLEHLRADGSGDLKLDSGPEPARVELAVAGSKVHGETRVMRPKRCPHLIETRMDDEVLLYDPAGDRTHRLNACASLIWEWCDGGHTVEDIAHTLTEQFEVAFEQALCDAQAVVQQLGEEQLVSVAPAA